LVYRIGISFFRIAKSANRTGILLFARALLFSELSHERSESSHLNSEKAFLLSESMDWSSDLSLFETERSFCRPSGHF